jgi:hypothetical protein
MSNQFIHVTIKQNMQNHRQGHPVIEDKELYVPITSIACVKHFHDDEYNVYLHSDISLEKVIGVKDYLVFAIKKDLGIE